MTIGVAAKSIVCPGIRKAAQIGAGFGASVVCTDSTEKSTAAKVIGAAAGAAATAAIVGAETVAAAATGAGIAGCLLYTSPSPRDGLLSRMPSSA